MSTKSHYAAAIAQLTIHAESCESNAPILVTEGNHEEAANCASNANNYRGAIKILQEYHATEYTP